MDIYKQYLEKYTPSEISQFLAFVGHKSTGDNKKNLVLAARLMASNQRGTLTGGGFSLAKHVITQDYFEIENSDLACLIKGALVTWRGGNLELVTLPGLKPVTTNYPGSSSRLVTLDSETATILSYDRMYGVTVLRLLDSTWTPTANFTGLGAIDYIAISLDKQHVYVSCSNGIVDLDLNTKTSSGIFSERGPLAVIDETTLVVYYTWKLTFINLQNKQPYLTIGVSDADEIFSTGNGILVAQSQNRGYKTTTLYSKTGEVICQTDKVFLNPIQFKDSVLVAGLVDNQRCLSEWDMSTCELKKLAALPDTKYPLRLSTDGVYIALFAYDRVYTYYQSDLYNFENTFERAYKQGGHLQINRLPRELVGYTKQFL